MPAPPARAVRQARAVLALAIAALVAVAIAAVVVVSGSTGGGGAPLLTTPGTISPDLGAASQCPAGAYDGHCIALPSTTTSTARG